MELQFSKIAKFAHPYSELGYFFKLLLNYNFPSRSNLHTLTVNLEVFRAGRVNGNNGLAGPGRAGLGLGRAGPGRAGLGQAGLGWAGPGPFWETLGDILGDFGRLWETLGDFGRGVAVG